MCQMEDGVQGGQGKYGMGQRVGMGWIEWVCGDGESCGSGKAQYLYLFLI